MDSEKDSRVQENGEDVAAVPVARKIAVEEDFLWNEIDYSERCLVSSMYQEAVEAATSCLRELCEFLADGGGWRPIGRSKNLREGEEREELGSMVEASGMVLLQALNGMGRSSEIFDVLTSIFKLVGAVPYPLFLTGVCLQLSAGLHVAAQTALESYLSGWKPKENSEDGILIKQVNFDGNCQRSVQKIDATSRCSQLTRAEYIQLAEIYLVEVLVLALKNPKAALLWINQANISEEEKKSIVDQVQRISRQERAKVKQKEQSADSYCASTAGPVGTPLQRSREQTGNSNQLQHEPTATHQTAEVAAKDQSTPKDMGQSNSKAVSKASGFCGRFPFTRTICKLVELVMVRIRGYLFSHYDNLPEGNLLLTGVFTSILVIALLRNRQRIIRLLTVMSNPVKAALSDLWQQAFSVQLNSLAAAQPFSTTRALVA